MKQRSYSGTTVRQVQSPIGTLVCNPFGVSPRRTIGLVLSLVAPCIVARQSTPDDVISTNGVDPVQTPNGSNMVCFMTEAAGTTLSPTVGDLCDPRQAGVSFICRDVLEGDEVLVELSADALCRDDPGIFSGWSVHPGPTTTWRIVHRANRRCTQRRCTTIFPFPLSAASRGFPDFPWAKQSSDSLDGALLSVPSREERHRSAGFLRG
jgi:hypothetical protein